MNTFVPRAIFALVPLFVAMPTSASAPSVSEDELVRAVQSISDFRAQDSFDSPPKPSFAGRTFVFDVTIPETSLQSQNFMCLSTWRYDQSSGTLKVNIRQMFASTYTEIRGPGSPLTGNDNHAYYGVPFYCHREPEGSYSAQNAFGAEATVATYREVRIGFSTYNVSEGRPFSVNAVDPMEFSRVMSPADGREMVQALRLRFSGTISNWGDGGSIGCTTDRQRPTFRSPVESERVNCLVSASDVRVDLIDSRTNEVLLTRSPTPPPTERRRNRRN